MSTNVLYYNVYTGSVYDANGTLYGNKDYSIYLDNTLDIEVHYVTEEGSGLPSTWAKWTDLVGKSVSSSVAVDNNMLHAYKGTLSEQASGAVTSLKVSLANVNSYINPTGYLHLFNASGQKLSVEYTAYTVASGIYTFTVNTTLTESYDIGSIVRVPEALLIKAEGSAIDDSRSSEGIFNINIYAMSNKLLELLDYSDTASLNAVMQHKIISEGNVIATYDLSISIQNLLDFNNAVSMPTTDQSELASKSWVLSFVRAGLEFQFSVDGNVWGAVQTYNSKYYRFRYAGYSGEWSPSVLIPVGQSPYIGTNGNWYVGTTDTGVKAAGGIYIDVLEIPFSISSTGTTSYTITKEMLGATGTPELELIDSNGFNITSDSRLSRRWTDSGYALSWAGGFPVGNYVAKPQGAKGADGALVDFNPLLSGNTVIDSTYGRVAYLDSTYTTMEFLENQYDVKKVSLNIVSCNSAVSGNIVLIPYINNTASDPIVVAVGSTRSKVDLNVGSVNGKLKFVRDITNALDTLKDTDVVTAIVLSIGVYYD